MEDLNEFDVVLQRTTMKCRNYYTAVMLIKCWLASL